MCAVKYCSLRHVGNDYSVALYKHGGVSEAVSLFIMLLGVFSISVSLYNALYSKH